ncbi:MAG: PBP1A family penicillin-binding protein [Deltaproteobacteria bacterium]|nr:PBP1A family penicillin-binding protein [Deltaproteobacteria bacterium]
MKRFFILLGMLAIILLMGAVIYLFHLTSVVQQRFSELRWDIPSKVFSESTHLFPGVQIQSLNLKSKLDRLGYRFVTSPSMRPGEYFIDSSNSPSQEIWILYLKDFDYPTRSFKGFPVRWTVKQGMLVSLEKVALKGSQALDMVELEPELISEFFRGIRSDREIAKLEALPAHLLNAIVVIEDARFLEHSGIDPKGILRAFLTNLKSGKIVQGGSTLTQQLVKNFFLTQKRSYSRKINEALMALIVESKYSKDVILEAYINEVYMGQRGSTSIHGMKKAAQFYFSKSLDRLTLSECAILGGMIQNPGLHSPFKNPKKTIQRRNIVLQKMKEHQLILPAEYQEALAEALHPSKVPSVKNSAPYFVDHVRQELLERYPENVILTQGLRIFTSLDIDLQLYANQAMEITLAALEKIHVQELTVPQNAASLQGALIAVQPQTGWIKALVGGKNYEQSQFNRVTQAKRQVGSLFKPLVFLTAFERLPQKYTLSTLLKDEPFVYEYDHHQWEPQNYEEKYYEEVSLRTALELSINIPTAKVALDVGIPHIAAQAKKMGITSYLPQVPSLALGSAEVSPLEMAGAYSTLANGGFYVPPYAIKHVVSPDGAILTERAPEAKKVVSEQSTYLITQALQGVLERGSGIGVRMFGFNAVAAGKTGTTNDYVDAWFAGYTSQLVAVSWVGFDQEKRLGLTGAQAALPLWTRFMLQTTRGKKQASFQVPEKIISVEIDPRTAQLATRRCPERLTEVFLKGTEPKTFCERHSAPVLQKKIAPEFRKDAD